MHRDDGPFTPATDEAPERCHLPMAISKQH
jgi:hypothetical protein